MTITIDLPPATAEKLQSRALAVGKDVETLIKEAIEAKLVISGLTFREILEPLHKEVEASGISEHDLTALVDSEVAAMRAERKAARTQK